MNNEARHLSSGILRLLLGFRVRVRVRVRIRVRVRRVRVSVRDRV